MTTSAITGIIDARRAFFANGFGSAPVEIVMDNEYDWNWLANELLAKAGISCFLAPCTVLVAGIKVSYRPRFSPEDRFVDEEIGR